MTDPLVWIDCEMTGLDLSRDALVEIACLVTDGDLKILDDGINLVIKPPAESLQTMPELVRAYIKGHIKDSRRVPLCGNSIATDRAFLARDMPELDTFLHYRMIDVSSIKELSRRWFPR